MGRGWVIRDWLLVIGLVNQSITDNPKIGQFVSQIIPYQRSFFDKFRTFLLFCAVLNEAVRFLACIGRQTAEESTLPTFGQK